MLALYFYANQQLNKNMLLGKLITEQREIKIPRTQNFAAMI
jgi:hypothetical protein